MQRHRTSHKLICWQVTRFCNRRCLFCTSRSSPEIQHPERNDETTILRLNQLGVEKISLSGGEPLLYPHIAGLLEMASDANISTVITTNGDFVNKRQAKKVNWRLPEYVKLSFYGNQRVHDQTMGKGHFQKLIFAASELSKQGARVGVNVMLTDNSIGVVEELFESLRGSDIDNVLLLSYMKQGRFEVDKKYALSENSSSALMSILNRWVDEYPNGIKLHNYNIPGFYLLLTDKEVVKLPSNDGTYGFEIGNLYAEFVTMPNIKGAVSMKDAFEAAWETRLNTNAIVAGS